MSDKCLLLCTDMDRTLLPNGNQSESPHARQQLAAFVSHVNAVLVYVTGRHLALVLNAIDEFDVPVPDYAITDVGAKIYHRHRGRWHALDVWEQEIDKAWAGKTHTDLKHLFEDLPMLVLQEEEKQNTHKLSYYVNLDMDVISLLNEMEQRLGACSVQASLIWSVDDLENTGLLDVLPRNATKLHAVDFLRRHLNYELNEIVFSGDSGNDLAVMSSEIPSVLVANASDQVKAAAETQAMEHHNRQTLYIADGSHLGMNGNYAAGILEGVWYFMPHLRKELEIVIGAHHGSK